MRGMGLIPTDTVFTSRKTRTQVKGSFASLPGVFHPLSAHPLEGYEIHMGITTRHGECRNLTGLHAVSGRQSEDKYDGACTADGSVCGTYVHGILTRMVPQKRWQRRLPAVRERSCPAQISVQRKRITVRSRKVSMIFWPPLFEDHFPWRRSIRFSGRASPDAANLRQPRTVCLRTLLTRKQAGYISKDDN